MNLEVILFFCNYYLYIQKGLGVIVFNTTYNNISVLSWQSVLLVEEPGVPGENHWPAASHWQSFLQVLLHQWTDRHDITEILLKVALNTITHPPPPKKLGELWGEGPLTYLHLKVQQTIYNLKASKSDYIGRTKNNTLTLFLY
jgi:hypothetical protein